MKIGNLIFSLNKLIVGYGCGPDPTGAKIKLGELLKNSGYNQDVIAAINADMLNGYSVAVRSIFYLYSGLYPDAEDKFSEAGVDGLEAKKLDMDLEQDNIRAVCSKITELDISSSPNPEAELSKILKAGDWGIGSVNADVVAGYNIGMSLLKATLSNYQDKLH